MPMNRKHDAGPVIASFARRTWADCEWRSQVANDGRTETRAAAAWIPRAFEAMPWQSTHTTGHMDCTAHRKERPT